ncbi:MAG: hypothetical protein K1060chlam2_01536 [Chlamydiae bacterium]|nr:hypothetical protein [Chlamydiota bacterium]
MSDAISLVNKLRNLSPELYQAISNNNDERLGALLERLCSQDGIVCGFRNEGYYARAKFISNGIDGRVRALFITLFEDRTLNFSRYGCLKTYRFHSHTMDSSEFSIEVMSQSSKIDLNLDLAKTLFNLFRNTRTWDFKFVIKSIFPKEVAIAELENARDLLPIQLYDNIVNDYKNKLSKLEQDRRDIKKFYCLDWIPKLLNKFVSKRIERIDLSEFIIFFPSYKEDFLDPSLFSRSQDNTKNNQRIAELFSEEGIILELSPYSKPMAVISDMFAVLQNKPFLVRVKDIQNSFNEKIKQGHLLYIRTEDTLVVLKKYRRLSNIGSRFFSWVNHTEVMIVNDTKVSFQCNAYVVFQELLLNSKKSERSVGIYGIKQLDHNPGPAKRFIKGHESILEEMMYDQLFRDNIFHLDNSALQDEKIVEIFKL